MGGGVLGRAHLSFTALCGVALVGFALLRGGHGVAACGKSLCVVDSNFRRMSIWSTDGERFIGAVKLDRLFGSPNSVVWTNDLTRAQDGTLYISAGVSRTGGKVAEGHVFRVTGL